MNSTKMENISTVVAAVIYTFFLVRDKKKLAIEYIWIPYLYGHISKKIQQKNPFMFTDNIYNTKRSKIIDVRCFKLRLEPR